MRKQYYTNCLRVTHQSFAVFTALSAQYHVGAKIFKREIPFVTMKPKAAQNTFSATRAEVQRIEKHIAVLSFSSQRFESCVFPTDNR